MLGVLGLAEESICFLCCFKEFSSGPATVAGCTVLGHPWDLLMVAAILCHGTIGVSWDCPTQALLAPFVGHVGLSQRDGLCSSTTFRHC